MIISTNPRFIFLHIPKTAGTSMEEALYDYHNYDYADDPHIELTHYYDYMSKDEFNSFYKFTVIRNPFNLLYSTWNYYVTNSNVDIEFNEWMKWRYDGSISDMEHRTEDPRDGNFRLLFFINRYPQTFWTVNRHGEFIIDRFLCFENIDKDTKELSDKLGLEEILLPKTNVNRPNDNRYIEYYNEESIEIVKKVFKIDLELFGYSEFQDEPVGGLWGENARGKKLSDFGFVIPEGVTLNVGPLPYGNHDIINRYFDNQNKEEVIKSESIYRTHRRLETLNLGLGNIKSHISFLNTELEERHDLTNEEISEMMRKVLDLTERELVYSRKIMELNKKLEDF